METGVDSYNRDSGFLWSSTQAVVSMTTGLGSMLFTEAESVICDPEFLSQEGDTHWSRAGIVVSHIILIKSWCLI